MTYLGLKECPKKIGPKKGETIPPKSNLLAERKKAQEARFKVYDEFAATLQQTNTDLQKIRSRFKNGTGNDPPEETPDNGNVIGVPDERKANGGIKSEFEVKEEAFVRTAESVNFEDRLQTLEESVSALVQKLDDLVRAVERLEKPQAERQSKELDEARPTQNEKPQNIPRNQDPKKPEPVKGASLMQRIRSLVS